ncbi:hypothetical protein [Fibrella aquatica]|uniref:hypothetical protein n=1 Tax=Fibrella aquatica TaxID=3242487 RepID=UPI0035213CA4
MPKHVRKWVISLVLNVVGVLLSLVVVYVTCVVVLLQLSTRAVTKNPLSGILNYESLVVFGGLIAIWLFFRFIGKVYALVMKPPRSK